jgi:hypothetical protein
MLARTLRQKDMIVRFQRSWVIDDNDPKEIV